MGAPGRYPMVDCRPGQDPPPRTSPAASSGVGAAGAERRTGAPAASCPRCLHPGPCLHPQGQRCPAPWKGWVGSE